MHSAISPFCTQLTTITPDLIGKEGISFEEALHILGKEYQAGQHAWASYGMYDKNMLQKQCALRHIPLPQAKNSARAFVRHFHASAVESEVDKQGRMTIPQELRKYVQVSFHIF